MIYSFMWNKLGSFFNHSIMIYSFMLNKVGSYFNHKTMIYSLMWNKLSGLAGQNEEDVGAAPRIPVWHVMIFVVIWLAKIFRHHELLLIVTNFYQYLTVTFVNINFLAVTFVNISFLAVTFVHILFMMFGFDIFASDNTVLRESRVPETLIRNWFFFLYPQLIF